MTTNLSTKGTEKIKSTLRDCGGHVMRIIDDTGDWSVEFWAIASTTMIIHQLGEDGCIVYRQLQDQNNVDAECEAIRDWSSDKYYLQALLKALQDQGVNPFGKQFREKYL